MAFKIMISNIFTYTTLLFLLMSPLFINSSPVPDNNLDSFLSSPSSIDKRETFVAFGDFKDQVTGRVTFTRLPNKCVRVTGQCNTGFTDPNPTNYKIRIVYRPLCPAYIRRLDLLPPMKMVVNVGGSSGFEGDFCNFSVDGILGMFVQVQLKNNIIGYAPIQAGALIISFLSLFNAASVIFATISTLCNPQRYNSYYAYSASLVVYSLLFFAFSFGLYVTIQERRVDLIERYALILYAYVFISAAMNLGTIFILMNNKIYFARVVSAYAEQTEFLLHHNTPRTIVVQITNRLYPKQLMLKELHGKIDALVEKHKDGRSFVSVASLVYDEAGGTGGKPDE
ncbi:11149_t:CDS:2 [Diversispora eburnea]|uniref:11149_t:CDS:1 n=1 Tax=Diversispora eburnea TaxID=1213867 RepID=A0A9N8VDC0_9GLOM|nr:11149_t:CDS:2 [Diversispora eburnea]